MHLDTHRVSGDTHTHTHTHMQLGGVGGMNLLPLSHPGVLPQGKPGAVGSQQCGARGPSPSAQSCLGQGQDWWASVRFLHVFCCCGVLWGEPRWTRGEHANSRQKGPGTSPDMLHHAGLEPTTFLLWGNSATHWATVHTDGTFPNKNLSSCQLDSKASLRNSLNHCASLWIKASQGWNTELYEWIVGVRVVRDHLSLGDLYGSPEERPQYAGVAWRCGQGAVVAVVFVQPGRQQGTDVEPRHFYSLICRLRGTPF